jgi:hypothetical protein
MNKHGIMTNVLIVSIVSLLIGALLGAAMVEPEQVTTYVDLPGETIYEQVLVNVTEIIEVNNPAFDDQLEELNVYQAALAYFNLEWQEEISINVSGTMTDYDDYIEDGSEYEVEECPDENDYTEVNRDVTLTEVDHEDSEWEAEWTTEFEDDTGASTCYTTTVTVEELVGDDLTLTATAC